jgi:hypothetical protein
MAIDDGHPRSIEVAAELAGYFVAHAVWCVGEGETLVPILAFQGRTGEQEFRRLEGVQCRRGTFAQARTLSLDLFFSVFQERKHSVEVFNSWCPTIENRASAAHFALTRVTGAVSCRHSC